MRRFTHTFPQRISAFLLCLALCLGLLPATALAAGTTVYGTIEVGGVALTNTQDNPVVYATTGRNHRHRHNKWCNRRKLQRHVGRHNPDAQKRDD